VWAEAAKWLGKFDEAVLTAFDVDGYPFSVRVNTHTYNADTGRLPVALPRVLRAVEGPAGMLCHYHDEKMWKLKAIQVKPDLKSAMTSGTLSLRRSIRRRNWRYSSFSKAQGPQPRSIWTGVDSTAPR
jgi:hypothetical protein